MLFHAPPSLWSIRESDPARVAYQASQINQTLMLRSPPAESRTQFRAL